MRQDLIRLKTTQGPESTEGKKGDLNRIIESLIPMKGAEEDHELLRGYKHE